VGESPHYILFITPGAFFAFFTEAIDLQPVFRHVKGRIFLRAVAFVLERSAPTEQATEGVSLAGY
jgi:hypothetical protein